MRTLEVLERVLKGKRVKPTTKRHYEEALGSLSRYSEDWPDNPVVINEWVNQIEGLADTTVNMYWRFGHSAGKYIEKVLKVDNPFKDADRVKVEKKRRRYFSAEELMWIIQACMSRFEWCLILTLIDSTCRIGELVNLDGCHVGNGFIDVKGKTGERRYRLDVRLCEALCQLADGADKPVFKRRDGKRSDVSGLKWYVRQVMKRAGLSGKKLGAHTLRHSGASLVARKTGSALVVKALLQHDKIDTSMEYIHDVEDSIQQGISPLQLVGEAVFGSDKVESEPLLLSDGGQAQPEIIEIIEGETGLTDKMFPVIGDGIEIRPLLRTGDLNLLRDIIVSYASHNGSSNRVYRAQELMRRMLRKVK